MKVKLSEIKKIEKALHKPFKKLSFDEGPHIYSIQGYEDRPIKSVSGLLKYFYEPFETYIESEKWAAKRGMNPEWVRAAWEGEGDIANAHGTKVHLFGENYVKHKFLGHEFCPVPFCKQSLGTVQFIDDLPDYLIPVCVELQMYILEYWYAGTCDGILYNTRNGKFIIYDYKTNKALTDTFPKGLLKHINPKHGLKQDNYGKYSLQFSFYQVLMESAGFEVQGRILVWLNEDKPKKKLYKTFKTVDLTDDLNYWLKSKVHF